MFHGVPDWVYEEEILEQNFALWFNDDGSKLAYLSFNETGVPTYRVPYYMDRNDPKSSIAPPYPRELEIRYPKVGARNPTVKVSLLNLNWSTAGPKPQLIDINTVTYFAPDDCIAGEVAWLGARVAIRTFNRVQDSSKLVLYDTRDGTTKVTKSQDGSDGWIDNTKTMHYIGQLSDNGGKDVWGLNGCCEEYFLDKTDLTNWDHYYLFPTMYSTNDPLPVTWGDYDARDIIHIDKAERVIFYTSTEGHVTESHLYAFSYRTMLQSRITDPTKPGFYSASFSPGSKYFVLNYEGPNVPYQELYSTANATQPIRIITSNMGLQDKLKEYKLPMIRYADLKHPLGGNISAMLRYPANFKPDKKYPLILTPYGGPGAQEVTKRMQNFDFKAYLASDPELEYFTYTVDNRGTGFRGREFRTRVSRHLGQLEAEDQVWAAAQLARQNRFIDRNKIAIWGWSYGGYLSAKVIESDSGIFSLGLITAPVSDWRLYDSMYTERFMGLPTTNAENYTTTAVRKVAGFKNVAGGVLLQHGTGDDNVHFQNSAALVDTLIGGGIGPDKLQVQYFPDSDHSMGWNGANRFVYKQLARRLWEEKVRPVNQTTPSHQWTRIVLESGSSVFSEGFGKSNIGGASELKNSWNTTKTQGSQASGTGMLASGTREYEEKLMAFLKTLNDEEVEKDTWTPFPGQA
jgi:dipeptidyl-peptidase-4